jgi:hypothetical protein
MTSMIEPSGYMLEPIREGLNLTLYRSSQHINTTPVLAIALTAQHPLPLSLRRLEHEYSPVCELDSAWAPAGDKKLPRYQLQARKKVAGCDHHKLKL